MEASVRPGASYVPPLSGNRWATLTNGEAWFVTIVLALVLVLGMGAVEVAAKVVTGG